MIVDFQHHFVSDLRALGPDGERILSGNADLLLGRAAAPAVAGHVSA